MFLTHEELTLLTGKQKKPAIVRALAGMRIPHFIRPDGLPVVSPACVQKELGGLSESHKHGKEPNFEDL